MRVAFAGTPSFAATALAALANAGHDISLVLTQPDRPAGRGLRLTPSAVAAEAASRDLPILKPASLKEPAAEAALRASAADVLVVAAYGLLLPAPVLAMPRHGCLNIHASLLPRWRGAAPVQRAILAGDAQTGITIMQMDAGLDTGPMLLRVPVSIGDRDTTGILTERLAGVGAEAIVRALERLAELQPQVQDPAEATHAPKVLKAEAAIDWAAGRAEIDRRVRAFNPFPGAEGRLGGEAIKVWEAFPAPGQGAPGEVLAADPQGVVVACGDGALRLTILQRPGGRRLSAGDFLRGFPLQRGRRFDPATA